MRQAQSMGRLSDAICPRQAAVGIIALLDGLVVNWTLEPNLFPLAEYAPAILDIYLRGLVRALEPLSAQPIPPVARFTRVFDAGRHHA